LRRRKGPCHNAGQEDDRPGLGLKDYIALFIAALETIILPLIIFALILVLLVLILR
jgi:hypothetical protein